MNLNDKICVITGSANGIGEKCALKFAEYGATLFLIDLDEKIKKINKVTKSSIETVANKLFTSTPTISSIGPIKNLETINQIQNRLN